MTDYSDTLSAVIDNHVPALDDLKSVIETALKSNFKNVEVNITDSPDTSKAPFKMTSSGFGKNLTIAEVGGPVNLFPSYNIDKHFQLDRIASHCQKPKASIFGPGAGPWPLVGVNSEMVADINLETGKTNTRIAKIDESHPKGYFLTSVDVPKCSLMANLALSDADQPAQTVHFKVSTRTGEENLTDTIQKALAAHYGEKTVSLAGIFIIHEGKAKLHVMPDFPGCPFKSNQEVDKWLNYFEMSAPLVCCTVMHSYDPGHNLRLEHTHCFSDHGDGGHYHYDTTPEEVVYEGWFTPSSKVFRFDNAGRR